MYNAAGLSPQRPGPNIPRPRERGTNLQLETKPVYRRSDVLARRRSSRITRRFITCKSVDQCDHLCSAAPRPRLCLTCHHKPKRRLLPLGIQPCPREAAAWPIDAPERERPPVWTRSLRSGPMSWGWPHCWKSEAKHVELEGGLNQQPCWRNLLWMGVLPDR